MAKVKNSAAVNTIQKTTAMVAPTKYASFAAALPKGAILMGMPTPVQNVFAPVTNAFITAWVNSIGGNMANVICVPLANVTNVTYAGGNTATPVPLGFGAKKTAVHNGVTYHGGQRGAMVHLNLFGVPATTKGVANNFGLVAINIVHSAIAKSHKYSHIKNYVTLGLLNGGFGGKPNNKTWGTSYLALAHVG